MKFTLAVTALLATEAFAAKFDYGPLYPTADETTGLYLLELPAGFTYKSFGWTGQIMDDGQPTPTDHDGMAVSGVDGTILSLVRNHECSRGEGPLVSVPGGTYGSGLEHGSNTNVYFDLATEEFTQSYASLAGIIRPCAGGYTPWFSWLSAEENFSVDHEGFPHGWLFDVPAFGTSDGVPIRSAGRFVHEATAVDLRTGIVYETEDRNPSGIYRYVMPGAGGRNWEKNVGSNRKGDGSFKLLDGGDLYALAIVGEPEKNMRDGFNDGDEFDVEWIKVTDPFAENTENSLTVLQSAPGAAFFERGEGMWFDHTDGTIKFVSTTGGAVSEGQVWSYNPRTDKLVMQYESRNATDVDAPDNIAVSEKGGIILCEDGGSDPKRLIGLCNENETFEFAKNIIELNEEDLALIDSIFPGTQENFWDSVVVEGMPGARRSFSGREWAGATFWRGWLFVNVQSPGVTFAIKGPWKKGCLR